MQKNAFNPNSNLGVLGLPAEMDDSPPFSGDFEFMRVFRAESHVTFVSDICMTDFASMYHRLGANS